MTAEAPPAGRRLRAFGAAALAGIALHLALLVAARPGFMASDDQVYARAAWDLVGGTFELQPEHRLNRLGLIAPTAAAYGLVGANAWTTVWWPLAWSLVGIVAVAYAANRLAGRRAAWCAVLLFAPATTLVNGSAFLIPDMPLGVQLFVATLLLLRARASTGGRAALAGAASAGVVALAIMTKETAIWLAPLHIVLLVRDLRARRARTAWAAYALTGATLGAVFFGAYAALTGDALYRWHAIDVHHNASHWAYAGEGAAELLRRATYQPLLMLFEDLPDLTLLLAAALPLVALRRAVPRGARVFAAQALVLAAGYWIGSSSLTKFAPLPLLPRMLAPTLPPLAVLAGGALVLVPGRIRWAALGPSALLLAGGALTGLAQHRPLAALVYAAGAAALAAAYLRPATEGARAVLLRCGVPALVLAMCAYGVARGGVGESRDMRAERRLAARLHTLVREGATLLSERRTLRALEFHRGFTAETRLALVDWDDWPDGPPAGAPPPYVWADAGRMGARKDRYAPPAWLPPRLAAARVVATAGDVRLVELTAR